MFSNAFTLVRTALPGTVSDASREKRSKGLRPTVFVPRTLLRTWGTHPEGWALLHFVISRRYSNLFRALEASYPLINKINLTGSAGPQALFLTLQSAVSLPFTPQPTCFLQEPS